MYEYTGSFTVGLIAEDAHMHLCMYVCTCMCSCMYVCEYVCSCMYVCEFVCMCLCVFICMYVCTSFFCVTVHDFVRFLNMYLA
jgi:hypothetical protein